MQKTSEWLLSFNSQEQKQIQALIHQRKTSDKPAIVTSITGGKGGVGKTSISLKLSKSLARLGHKVLLIDCDYNLSNTAIKLGLPLNNSNFYSLLTAQKEFIDCLYKEGNFHLLSACNGDISLFETKLKFEELMIDIIQSHQDEYDFIFLDCPAGLNKESLILNAYCDHRVFVVTPDKASITDSYSLMKVLAKKFGIKENHLVVNMITSKKQFANVITTLCETVENFLGCRTNILGGVQRVDVEYSRFDQYFLEGEENSAHKKFLKVVHKFVDESSRHFDDVIFSQGQTNTEHEVQPLS
jgi:flagellar biosynthesis protein FlhG